VIEINAASAPRIAHDFRGFPGELYQMEYPCPGAPELAVRIATLVASAGFEASLEKDSFLDHGVWIPLRILFPEANVPTVQVSLPHPSQPERVLKLGHALASLRDEGVLLVGSGGLVHNLEELVWHQKEGPGAPWAVEFDEWVRARLTERDVIELCGFEEGAPHARRAHPTTEHFYPLFFALGASCPGDGLEILYQEIQYSTLSMTCFALKPEASF
jgi:4,5-DOPA dioxygenase extradiol